MGIGRFNLIPRTGLEPTVRIDICENTEINHFAIKAFCTSRNGSRFWPWVRVLAECGLRGFLPTVKVPFLRRTDTGFQTPVTYLGDEQMLRILGRGHSVPTVTELIFVRAQCLTILLFKHFSLRGTIKWIQLIVPRSSKCLNSKMDPVNCSVKCKMLK